jgi:hypothetical protein
VRASRFCTLSVRWPQWRMGSGEWRSGESKRSAAFAPIDAVSLVVIGVRLRHRNSLLQVRPDDAHEVLSGLSLQTSLERRRDVLVAESFLDHLGRHQRGAGVSKTVARLHCHESGRSCGGLNRICQAINIFD